MDMLFSDEYFMKQALEEARKALERDEVPVGAVVVAGNRIIARGHNLSETLHDATAHAEMQALTAAQDFLGSKYLNECTLYVTLEPCPMCAGATYLTQLGKLVYGASDPKRGYSVISPAVIHPKTKIVSGVFEPECSTILSHFFKKKRPR